MLGGAGRGQCRTVRFDAVKVSRAQVLSSSVVPGIGRAMLGLVAFCPKKYIRGISPRIIFNYFKR